MWWIVAAVVAWFFAANLTDPTSGESAPEAPCLGCQNWFAWYDSQPWYAKAWYAPAYVVQAASCTAKGCASAVH